MLNRITLIGRLTHDPKLQYTQSGVAVANFTLAVDRNFKNAAGEKETDFIDVIVWRKQAETCVEYLAKGKMAAVDGRLQVRSYEAKDGSKRKAVEVIAESVNFLSPTAKNEEKPFDTPSTQEAQAVGPFDSADNYPTEEELSF